MSDLNEILSSLIGGFVISVLFIYVFYLSKKMIEEDGR